MFDVFCPACCRRFQIAALPKDRRTQCSNCRAPVDVPVAGPPKAPVASYSAISRFTLMSVAVLSMLAGMLLGFMVAHSMYSASNKKLATDLNAANNSIKDYDDREADWARRILDADTKARTREEQAEELIRQRKPRGLGLSQTDAAMIWAGTELPIRFELASDGSTMIGQGPKNTPPLVKIRELAGEAVAIEYAIIADANLGEDDLARQVRGLNVLTASLIPKWQSEAETWISDIVSRKSEHRFSVTISREGVDMCVAVFPGYGIVTVTFLGSADDDSAS